MADLPIIDYNIFKRKILRATGLDLNSYKQNQMERRIRSFMDRSGAINFQQYYKMLETDKALMTQFLDKLTINTSELFRNPEQFQVLEENVLPELLKQSSSLRVWSAGCSYGQEPYSLAICLEEAAPNRRHKVFATDIDDRALEHTKAGSFMAQDARNLTEERKQRWFRPQNDDLKAMDKLQRMITVNKLDLLKDDYPQELDLIVCRNVVIYFTDTAKQHLYTNFFDALKPGGYLFIGSTERVSGYSDIGYINQLPFFYRKPANF